MTTVQTRFIDALAARAEADPRIRAAWLAGSFGKGMADRWSDVDAHLLLDSSALDEFSKGVEAWLAQIRPLVFVRRMFDGQMVNAMTDEAMRLDVWLHDGAPANVTEGETRVLYAEEGALAWQPQSDEELTPEAAANELRRAIPEFWRCVSILPVIPGRDEKLVGAGGNFLILMLLADVLSVASGRRRDRGREGAERVPSPAIPPVRRGGDPSQCVKPGRVGTLSTAIGPHHARAWPRHLRTVGRGLPARDGGDSFAVHSAGVAFAGACRRA